MQPHNAYPEKPELPYQPTQVMMADVVKFLQEDKIYIPEVKQAAYVIFRNESGNGQHGVNNNYAGIQADGNRWHPQLDQFITGTCVAPENVTGRQRRFICFQNVGGTLSFLLANISSRGLYQGVNGIVHPSDWVIEYYRKWVTGNPSAIVPTQTMVALLSMYQQAEELFK